MSMSNGHRTTITTVISTSRQTNKRHHAVTDVQHRLQAACHTVLLYHVMRAVAIAIKTEVVSGSVCNWVSW